QRLTFCPWCELAGRLGQDLFPAAPEDGGIIHAGYDWPAELCAAPIQDVTGPRSPSASLPVTSPSRASPWPLLVKAVGLALVLILALIIAVVMATRKSSPPAKKHAASPRPGTHAAARPSVSGTTRDVASTPRAAAPETRKAAAQATKQASQRPAPMNQLNT